MTEYRVTKAAVPAGRIEATPPLVLHPRGGVVIVALLLLTLGLMFVPLMMHMVPVG